VTPPARAVTAISARIRALSRMTPAFVPSGEDHRPVRSS
jgi:hypothetical protein